MDIADAIAVARADERRLTRFIDRRDRFLDCLDWNALPKAHAREASMLDELLNGDLADAASYTAWLEERAADGVESVAGVLRFDPRPRPWHAEWMTLCRASSFNGSL